VAGADVFDSGLFSITGAEAELMDPQQRLLLEVSYEAMQKVGRTNCDADTGVYIGIQQMEYGGLAAPHLLSIGPFSATGGSFSVAAGRMSFTYGFKGPAVSMDTACSSAMVATHTAATYLRTSRKSTTTLAGGVNLLLSEATLTATQAAGMLAVDGRCKALDAAANGYVRAEACVVLILSVDVDIDSQPLAMLTATAVNQDGRSSSLTAPNGPAQQVVIRAAITSAGVMADSVSGLQMHGTGTALGDPIEVGAALAVLPGASGRLRLTAAKSRVGHTEPVAGLVGLIHAANMIGQDIVQSTVHLRNMNPLVTSLLAGTTQAEGRHRLAPRQEGPAPATIPTLCGVSAFAFQGTNAHALISASLDVPQYQEEATLQRKSNQWQRRRHWFALQPHALLYRASSDAVSRATFSLDFNQPRLSYLLDHQVSGRALLPGASMLEAAHAGALRLLSTNQRPSLIGITIASPVVMSFSTPGAFSKTSTIELNVRLDSGHVALQGTLAGVHLSCSVASTALSGQGDHSVRKKILSSSNLIGGGIRIIVENDDIAPAAATGVISNCDSHQPQQYHVHPAALDCATQTGSALQMEASATTRVPVGLEAYLGSADMGQGEAGPSTAVAMLQGRIKTDDSVTCGYRMIHADCSTARRSGPTQISGMQFKPLGPEKLSPRQPSSAMRNARWGTMMLVRFVFGLVSLLVF